MYLHICIKPSIVEGMPLQTKRSSCRTIEPAIPYVELYNILTDFAVLQNKKVTCPFLPVTVCKPIYIVNRSMYFAPTNGSTSTPNLHACLSTDRLLLSVNVKIFSATVRLLTYYCCTVGDVVCSLSLLTSTLPPSQSWI